VSTLAPWITGISIRLTLLSVSIIWLLTAGAKKKN
jgi:hypothetical protein